MILLILAGILGYVFLARVFNNMMFERIDGIYKYRCRFNDEGLDDEHTIFLSTLFPVVLVFFAGYYMCKLPIKLADFICNPANYKFSVKIERKDS